MGCIERGQRHVCRHRPKTTVIRDAWMVRLLQEVRDLWGFVIQGCEVKFAGFEIFDRDRGIKGSEVGRRYWIGTRQGLEPEAIIVLSLDTHTLTDVLWFWVVGLNATRAPRDRAKCLQFPASSLAEPTLHQQIVWLNASTRSNPTSPIPYFTSCNQLPRSPPWSWTEISKLNCVLDPSLYCPLECPILRKERNTYQSTAASPRVRLRTLLPQ